MLKLKTSFNLSPSLARVILYCGFALLVLALVSLHTYHFAGREYRQDEAWAVHGVMVRTIPEIFDWMARAIHPPVWRSLAKIWVEIFGHHEAITRFFSTLLTLLTFALVYRLGRDLFDWRTGLLAVFLLGTLPMFQFYTHEIRPYAMLLATTTAMQLTFLRWLRRPDFHRALWFVVASVVAIYSHFYGLMMVAALAVYFVLFVRWERGLYLRAFGLFVAIGLSFSGWLLPFIHSFTITHPGGINYALEPRASRNIWETIAILYNQMQTNPPRLELALVALGAVVPLRFIPPQPSMPAAPFRFGAAWRKLYIVSIALLLLAIPLISNQFVTNVTPRNMTVVLPALALVAAVGLRALPWIARLAVIVVIAYFALTSFRAYINIGPYHEILTYISPHLTADTRFVVNTSSMPTQIEAIYYLRERLPLRLPDEQFFHMMQSPFRLVPNMASRPANLINAAVTDGLQRFEAFLATAPHVWYVENAETRVNYGEPFMAVLDEQFAVVREALLPSDPYAGRRPYRVREYRPLPDDLETRFRFGDALTLQGWHIGESVNVRACETVTITSWWRTGAKLDAPYSATLVLADGAGMGITRSDQVISAVWPYTWDTARVYLDERPLTVPCEAEPGEYALLVDVYDPETVTFLPASLPDDTPLGQQVYLTTLFVE